MVSDVRRIARQSSPLPVLRCREDAPRLLLGEVSAVRCWEGKMSSARVGGQVTSAVGRSRERLYTHIYTHTLTHTHPSSVSIAAQITPRDINNGQLIIPEWFSAALSLRSIHGRFDSIPHPPLALKWDDMGLFMSTKIAGILAVGVGKISHRGSEWADRKGRCIFNNCF